MIGISEIASYIPSGFETNAEKKNLFGIDDVFIRDKLGIDRLARKSKLEETSDLCVAAWQALKTKNKIDINDIDCLIVCTQNPDKNGIPHTSAIVHGKIGGPDKCASFDIGLGCSGYVYTLSIAIAFMQFNGLSNGLLFTADPYSKIIDPLDKNTALLFGDGATVTLLQPLEDGGRWIPTRFKFGTRGSEGQAINNNTGQLQMNGRAVFNFSATTIPSQIRTLLEIEGLTSESVDKFLLHQGSKFIQDTLIERLELPIEKVPTNLFKYGNTISSTIPLLLEDAIKAPDNSTMVISGFGVGLSWASGLLKRT